MNIKSQKGFTIVELLIVIVVIGILAAITIVAFNGVQARSKTAASQSAANNMIKKVQVYSADDSVTDEWPATGSVLTTAAATTLYRVDGVTLGTPASTASEKTVRYMLCGTGATTAAPTTVPAITTRTGARVDYFNYQTGAIVTNVTAGTTSGLVGTNNVGCVTSN